MPLIGEIAALTAAVFWAISLTLYTHFGRGIPSGALNLYKMMFATTGLIGFIILNRNPWPQDNSDAIMLGLSGLIGLAVSDTALFMALKRLGASLTSVIQSLVPPLSAILAWFFLNESLSVIETIGLAITTTAVTFVVYLGRDPKEPSLKVKSAVKFGITLAVIAAACQACSMVLTRSAVQNTDPVMATVIRMMPAALLLFLFNAQSRKGIPIIVKNPVTRLWISLAALLGTLLGLVLYRKSKPTLRGSTTMPMK